jgi:ABC-type cobalamin transport system ATPase subunit
VLLLKSGRVLAAGRKADALNSKNLSAAFNTRMQLFPASQRYGLKVF